MNRVFKNLKLLLVDDEDDFRQAAAQMLSRKGFIVIDVKSGEEALQFINRERPDVVLLDLKMPGLSGIETLQKIREIYAQLPVIILTGYAEFDNAVAAIKLGIADFLQKPVDVDKLGATIQKLLETGRESKLREHTIAELMVSPDLYPKIYVDEPISVFMKAMRKAFYQPVWEGVPSGQVRSVLTYDRNDKFIAIIRIDDILKLLLPAASGNDPHALFFTGMFLAQCKIIGNRSIEELALKQVFVDVHIPLMEAVNIMIKYHSINLPVMKDHELIGILRGRDVVLEIAESLGSLE